MSEPIQCYNRGCGQKFNPQENKDDSCRHHPGDPFFHDAYKGWSCCNKKCTDFTEFLNIKGCTLSKHSNVKPPEPEKPVSNVSTDEVIEVKPIVRETIARPPLGAPLITLKPEIAPSLKQQLSSLTSVKPAESGNGNEVAIGTICKNGGCNKSYEGPQTDETPCVHHPGTPVFHEGLKYWSCCTKRTSDFNAFLSQVGCSTGKHLWIKEESDPQAVQCRWDFHQTGTHVIVSVYAKQYNPEKSFIKINPIRLVVNLVFPQQGDACFSLDYELQGIIDTGKSEVVMYGTKVEIKLKKAEPGSWSRLEVPIVVQKETESPKKDETISEQIEQVDLNDL